MSMYPSLEDMKVDQMAQAQVRASQAIASAAQYYPQQGPPSAPGVHETMYPTLDDYMGLSLTSEELAFISQPVPNAVAIRQPTQISVPSAHTMVAPLSGASLGLQRAQVTHGIREATLCKDGSGKVGMRLQAVQKGVFVQFVQANSPAAVVGLRFGDQILQIDGDSVAGFSMEKVHNIIKKCPANGIKLVVRDRPFERTITLHKDSSGHIGFSFKDGKINAIVKDSSAAKNGLLIDHNILEINGQNVVGISDKEKRKIMDEGGEVITLTLIPSFIYEHIVKNMATGLVKKLMDHSIPDL